MIQLDKEKINIPLTVPPNLQQAYLQNFMAATKNSGRLFLFAGDQKIEHLNQDFFGYEISPQDANPKHMFEIADQGNVGAFATHLGLISRYAQNYKNINYIVKLNGKTNIVPKSVDDPINGLFQTVDQIVDFKKNSGLNIVGVGYTLYIGGRYENQMLHLAAQTVLQAHQNGLLAILWIYPRGQAIQDELAIDLISGATGVGACLGADFIKINPPAAANSFESANLLKQATNAAGLSKVICSGGTMKNTQDFLTSLYHQIHTGGTSGIAVGRNLHQRNLDDAITFCNSISGIIFNDAEVTPP